MPNPLVELTRCFNPCFIGTYSITLLALVDPGLTVTRFNPCFIGTYSITDSPIWFQFLSKEF